MRIVIDTDVMLSGLQSPTGASRLILAAALERKITVLESVATMIEHEAVLKRPEHLARASLDAGDIDTFLDIWAAIAEPVTIHYSWRPSVTDPDDDKFADLAVNGAADVLLTFNLRDYRPSDPSTRLAFLLCRPGDFLRRLPWRPSPDTLSGSLIRSWRK